MKPVTRIRLLCGGVGGAIGFGTGLIFLLFSPSSLPFALFLPLTFAVVFATISAIAAEAMFSALWEILSWFLALGGAAFIWHHFKK